jgi:hypothetical protein
VFDGVDLESAAGLLGEADAVIADAEALLAVLALQGLDAARAGFGQAVNRRDTGTGDGA